MSPKFKEQDGFVFKIYSNEEERKHVHIIKADKEAKCWLEPKIEIAENYGFTDRELKKIMRIIIEHGDEFKEQFASHIGKRIND